MNKLSGRSRSIFFEFVARLFSRTRFVQRTSQVFHRLHSAYSQVAPVFPTVLAFSILFAKESEEKMADLAQAEAVAIIQAEALQTKRNTKECNETEAVRNVHKFLLDFKDCKNAELLWRLARATRDLGQLSVTDANSKKTLTYESHEVAKKALELDDENFACHKWFAITLSDVGDFESTKQKISNAYKIRDHFKKAVELNPSDPTCFHLLGRWCFTVADVPWYQKTIASAIFDTPPSSSFEEAIDYFESAERLNPGFYSMNQLMLGKSNLKIGKTADARRWLEQLTKYDKKTEEDDKAVAEGNELLRSC